MQHCTSLRILFSILTAAEYVTFGLTPPQIGAPSVKMDTLPGITNPTVISSSRAGSRLSVF